MPEEFVPMSAQWAAVDELADKYIAVLRGKNFTSADIAMDLLATETVSEKRFMAMFAATLMQRLLAQ